MKIIIKQLFNQFDYELDIFNDEITIITGPNGFGKSTILKMIKCLSNGVFGIISLSYIPFQYFYVERNNVIIEIKKEADSFIYNNSLIRINDMERLLARFIRRNRYIYSFDDEHIIDKRSDKVYTMSEYIDYIISNDEFFDDDEFATSINRELMTLKKDVLNIVQEKSKDFGNVYFLEEQRLIKRNHISKKAVTDDDTINIIDEIPSKMMRIFSDYTTKYSSYAAGLDSSFPNRLFKQKKGINESDYNNKLDDFINKYSQMKKYELANIDFTSFTYNQEYSKVLKVYFDDFQSKYNIYEDFIEKLELFTEIVNSRLSFKKIYVSKDYGIKVLNDETDNIPLSSLSSGEKQEIVLFFELIFDTPKGALLLIDEPEISLHVAWQKKFISDLLRVMKISNSSAIIATHSPQIIDSRWEIIKDLGELYELSKERID